MAKGRTFKNVWDAIEHGPENAATMTLRSKVIIAIIDKVRRWNMTQARAARQLGLTQPRLNDLLRGHINKFSLDALLTLPTRAGLEVKINIGPAARHSTLNEIKTRLATATPSRLKISPTAAVRAARGR